MRRTATGLGEQAVARLAGFVEHHEHSRKFSSADRQRAVQEGAAMAGGRYPIYSQADLKHAVDDYNRTGQPSDVKAHILKRAKALNLKTPFQEG